MKTKLALTALGLALALTGCKSIGPRTIPRDRAEYSDSISDSWKRQTLLNIVKLRYFDPPIFVDVGQIVAGYSFETSVNAGGQVSSANAIQGNSTIFGGSAKFTDRPTVTYVPLTGNKFVKSLMTPLPPESVFSMIQAGWPADAVLFAAAASINGLKNQQTSVAGTLPPEPEFLRAIQLLRKIQLSGGVALRIQKDVQKNETMLMTFRRENIAPEALADSAELRRLLRLSSDATEFKLVFGEMAINDQEVAVLTRSILQLMHTMAAQVEVPAKDLAEKRVPPGWESVTWPEGSPRIIEVHSAESNPPDAFVAVKYRGHWFSIDDRDLKSKRAFSFMMMLFTLADSGVKESMPLITIPAQ